MPVKKTNILQQDPYVFKVNSEGDGEMWRGNDLIGTGDISAGVDWALANGAPNVLPEVTSYGYAPIVLNTYYPLRAPYYATGHSSLDVPITNRMAEHFNLKEPGTGKSVGLSVDKTGAANDYNLVTNNCSDATREVLEAISGKKMNPIGFTTPGDVRDFALEKMHGKRKVYTDPKTGELVDQVIIPRNKHNADRIDKRTMKWYTKKNPTNSDAFDETAYFYDYAEGGNMNKTWNDLSVKEKREIMNVAIKRGISNLDDIKREYNDFILNEIPEKPNLYKGGGNKASSNNAFYPMHRARWQQFLTKKGLSAQDAFRLSGYFAAQDAFESGYGKSTAAVEGNNYGGMQHNRKNIKYASINDYFEDKWKMMRNRFSRALGAKSLEEYANLINDPRYIGKGYLYCVYDGYNGKGPIDPKKQAAMQKHYTNTMLNIAGQSGFVGRRIPSQTAMIELPEGQDENLMASAQQPTLPYTPSNPQAFFQSSPNDRTIEINTPAPTVEMPSAEDIERQERLDGMNAFASLMNMAKSGNSANGAMGMLSSLSGLSEVGAEGNISASGGKIHIKKSKRGTFTAAAKKHGKSVQQFASQVLAHPENYSPAMRKKANFARNASKWHAYGGNLYNDGGPKKPAWMTQEEWEQRQKEKTEWEEYKKSRGVQTDNKPRSEAINGRRYVRNLGESDEDFYARVGEISKQLQEESDRHRTEVEKREQANARGANRFSRTADVVQGALNQQASETPFTGQGYQRAVEAQRQEKLDKFHETADNMALVGKSALLGTGIIGGFGNIGTQFAVPMLGGESVDLGTQIFTPYSSWGNMVSQTTGMPEWLGGFTNPGYFLPYGKIAKAATKFTNQAAPNSLGANESFIEQKIPQITSENAANIADAELAEVSPEAFVSLNTETKSNLPPVLKATKAMRAADSDVAAMNAYHDANVTAYNEATGSNIRSIPFRTDAGATGRQVKLLPDDKFNAAYIEKRLQSNAPTDDVRAVGGFYSRKDDTVYLRQSGSPSNNYHEFLHSNDYGITNPEVTKWRIDQLVDSEKIKNLSPADKSYYLSEVEFPVHLRQQGEAWDIKVGDPFPGEEAFDKMLFDRAHGGSSMYVKGMDVDASLEDKKLAWRALNGTLFNYAAPIGIGLTGYGLYNKKAYGGNLFSGTQNHSQWIKKDPVYIVMPQLFAKDGVKITVTSGLRTGKNAFVHKNGKPTNIRSRHGMGQAVDIVGDFKAIRRVLDDPNSHVSRWMMANGYGYLDETSATGTTKHWHDHKRDHSHYHIGTDPCPVSRYRALISGLLGGSQPVPVEQQVQPMQMETMPMYTPADPRFELNRGVDIVPMTRDNVQIIDNSPVIAAANPTPEQIAAQERKESVDNLNMLASILGSVGGGNNAASSFLGKLAGLSGLG